ncbi:U3 snoRNP protein [Cichlidogyrus casuarinus]|uniref:U3 snoRNP protein n=1 Tax=Cichlidogyrus casuarinus TaxID=1844966 RepID=A0ABD2QNS0_9PLAT
MLISPVGNQLTAFDLQRDESWIIHMNSDFDLRHNAVSPCGNILVSINEFGQTKVISLVTGVPLSVHNFRHALNYVCFSPNGQFFAIANGNYVQVFRAPKLKRQFSAFELYHVYIGASADVTKIDWTSDGEAFIASSKDCSAKIYSLKRCDRLKIFTLTGHNSAVMGAYFFENSLDNFCISEDGKVSLFRANAYLPDLHNVGDKVDFRFQQKWHYTLSDSEQKIGSKVSASDFSKPLNILVTGFEDGLVLVHMMPHFQVLSECQLMVNLVNCISLSKSGELVGMASEELGQLAVWEWRTESALLKIESHANDMSVLSYSPDGLHLATGGADFRVKIWRVTGGKCLVSFAEHQAPVTGLCFPASKAKVFVSCSLDGTVRAFDLHRYRNFRTLTVPSRQVQLCCLATDREGDLVCAAAQDSFEAFLWSLQTGHLLVLLSGHTSQISSMQFNLAGQAIEIATASWDGTVRLWEVGACYSVAAAGEGDSLPLAQVKEVLPCDSDVLALCYRSDGRQLAVCVLTRQILFFNVATGDQTGAIDARHDLGAISREADDLVTSNKLSQLKKILSICYSIDGEHLIAGGESKYVCLYSVKHETLIKRFQITCNLSLAGVQEIHDRRLFLADLAKGKHGTDIYDSEDSRATLALPGVKSGDKFGRRWYRPEVKVSCIDFAPTGDAFACATTEGVLVFSSSTAQTHGMLRATSFFDAISGGGLGVQDTPTTARLNMQKGNYSHALDIALRLRIFDLIQEVIESVPFEQIDYLARNISLPHVAHCMLDFLAIQLSSRHVTLYSKWSECILRWHAASLRQGLAISFLNAAEKRPWQSDEQVEGAGEEKRQKEEAFRERMRAPGRLVQRSEWAQCQASLVRLEAALQQTKTRVLEPVERTDATMHFLRKAAQLSK